MLARELQMFTEEEKTLLIKVGNKIKQLRADKGISQQELAALIDYEKSNMSRLEAGNTNPTITTLNKVAKALGVPLHGLLSD